MPLEPVLITRKLTVLGLGSLVIGSLSGLRQRSFGRKPFNESHLIVVICNAPFSNLTDQNNRPVSTYPKEVPAFLRQQGDAEDLPGCRNVEISETFGSIKCGAART